MEVDIASFSMDDVVGVALLAEEVVGERAEMLLSDDAAAPPNAERTSPKPAVKSDLMALLSSWAWTEKTRRARMGMLEMEKRMVSWLRGLQGRLRFGAGVA